MDAKLIAQYKSPTLTSSHWKPKHPCVVGVLARPAHDISGERRKTNVYKDGLFDRIAINHLSKCVQEATGLINSKSGYESLVEAATVASQRFSPIEQHQVVIQALDRAFPKKMLLLIRILLPQSKFARKFFAFFTTLFFTWLVGPSEVRESEVDGRGEKNIVHIKKCRFLEEANCVGMCINLCKLPSQSFIKDSLGMSVNMVPNFDDMSCEMVFGQDPPESTEDPALKQPCFKAKRKNAMEQIASLINAAGFEVSKEGIRVPHLSYGDKADTQSLGKQLSGPMHFKPITSHLQLSGFPSFR